MIKVACELQSIGHNVCFVTGYGVESLIKGAGLKFVGIKNSTIQSTKDFFYSITNQSNLDEASIMRSIISLLPQTFKDIERIFLEIKPDAVFVDSATYAAAAVSKLHKFKWATSCVFPDMIPTRSCIPLEYRINDDEVINVKDHKLVFKLCEQYENQLSNVFDEEINSFLDKFSLKAKSPAVLNANLSSDLIIAYTAKEWEYPRNDWPAQLHMVGPDRWELGDKHFELPSNQPLIYI
ncbi:MAG: hypothetical protein OMM_14709, partial [Candidatus Magnetoglobus multicellularis str. Araruama]